MTISYYVW